MIRRWTWWTACAALALQVACVTETDETTSQHAATAQDTVVTPAIARAVAEVFQIAEGGPMRHVRTTTTLGDASQRTALYAFNFEEGGFAVVSGELQFAPILAFSDEGRFDLTSLLPGVDDWVTDVRTAIEAVRGRSPADDAERAAQIAVDREERESWRPLLDLIASRSDVTAAELANARAITEPDLCDGGPCYPVGYCTSFEAYQWGPWVKSKWGQGCSYNQQVPATANASYCFHSPTGCTATALSQVINFHKHARWHSYTWTMPNGPTGDATGVTSRHKLMSETGVAAGATYGWSSTSAPTAGAQTALQSYGYFSYLGTLSGNLSSVARTEMKVSRPILLRGSSTSGTGHIWVVDGLKEMIGQPEGCIPKAGSVKYYFHYNWGWDGSSNGWYKDGAFGSYTGSRKYLTAVPQ